MAVSQTTFSDAGGSVSDLFAGIGDLAQGALKAKGLNIQASGIRLKAQGDLAEASEYDLSSSLATASEKFTEQSQAIKQMQQDRSNETQIGGQKADIAGSGGAASGSALDILRDSASQGALTKAVLGQQGLITEAGFTEQANSFNLMASTARTTAAGEESIADQTDQLATQTEDAAKTAATGSFISSAIKGVAAVASIGLAPFTDGLSLAALPTIGADGLSAIH